MQAACPQVWQDLVAACQQADENDGKDQRCGIIIKPEVDSHSQ